MTALFASRWLRATPLFWQHYRQKSLRPANEIRQAHLAYVKREHDYYWIAWSLGAEGERELAPAAQANLS
jgi:hypothetical protein